MTTHDDDGDLTAPTLLWLHTRPAQFVAGVFVVATVASLPNYGASNHSLPWLIVAVAIVTTGIVAVMATRTDPMPPAITAAAAASVPLGALVTALALPGHVANPNQTNALGAGVAVCAFLCVRGRVWPAWTAQGIAVGVMAAWGHWTHQGVWTGLQVAVPNLAVLAMATMFAYIMHIMRPAAQDIRDLRTLQVSRRGEIAASNERIAQRHRHDELLERAWPSIALIGSERHLTPTDIDDVLLLEAEVREAIRAPFFDAVPELRAAARVARARGVEVELLDDHGMDDTDDQLVTTFRRVAAQWLTEAADGKITLRVFPPGKDGLASIVAIAADDEVRTFNIASDGTLDTRP